MEVRILCEKPSDARLAVLMWNAGCVMLECESDGSSFLKLPSRNDDTPIESLATRRELIKRAVVLGSLS